jgi:hypothetical protein
MQTEAQCRAKKKWKQRNPDKVARYNAIGRHRNAAKRTAQTTAWKRRNPDKVIDNKRAWKYGLTPEAAHALWEDQDFCCGVCHLPIAFYAAIVDHNHLTGKVRGLTCNECNLGIGKLGDNIAGLRRALAYLERTDGEDNAVT